MCDLLSNSSKRLFQPPGSGHSLSEKGCFRCVVKGPIMKEHPLVPTWWVFFLFLFFFFSLTPFFKLFSSSVANRLLCCIRLVSLTTWKVFLARSFLAHSENCFIAALVLCGAEEQAEVKWKYKHVDEGKLQALACREMWNFNKNQETLPGPDLFMHSVGCVLIG